MFLRCSEDGKWHCYSPLVSACFGLPFEHAPAHRKCTKGFWQKSTHAYTMHAQYAQHTHTQRMRLAYCCSQSAAMSGLFVFGVLTGPDTVLVPLDALLHRVMLGEWVKNEEWTGKQCTRCLRCKQQALWCPPPPDTHSIAIFFLLSSFFFLLSSFFFLFPFLPIPLSLPLPFYSSSSSS